MLAARSLTAWDLGGALLIAPILIAATYPFLRRFAAQSGGRRELQFLVFVLVLRLGAAFIRYFVIAEIYGRGDALGYDAEGSKIADRFRAGLGSGQERIIGTSFIELLTGSIYFVTGRTLLGAFVVFAWFSFIGHLLWYRAIKRIFPGSAHRNFARMLFLFPSLLFWPTSIGKEAWMTLAIGLAVYGLARATTGGLPLGMALHGLGLWAMAMVRPHFAILIASSAGLAFVIGKFRSRVRGLGSVAKVAALGVMLVLMSTFAAKAGSFFGLESVERTSVIGVFEETQRRSTEGGSEFESQVVESPHQVPFATVNVLFRPLIFEAHNALALLTALESTFLALLAVRRFRHLRHSIRALRRSAFVAFCALYVLAFSAAFASIANFGILARQRTLMLPAFFVLLYVPISRRRAERAPEPEPEPALTASR